MERLNKFMLLEKYFNQTTLVCLAPMHLNYSALKIGFLFLADSFGLFPGKYANEIVLQKITSENIKMVKEICVNYIGEKIANKQVIVNLITTTI